MKKIIILFLTIFIYSSCEKPEAGFALSGPPLVDIAFCNQEGLDLLDPNNALSFKESEIDIYTIIDGEKTQVYEANLDYPEHFYVYYHDDIGKYFLRIFSVGDIIDGISTTYINFGDGTEDRIDFAIAGSSVIKVWYNEVLMWDVSNAMAERIEIIK
ncbi:MAG: hypothetical protein PF484_01325 [Bacteroidales bacterium]|jgi:hypothetical protein|nr:hypothetical protein [Bacteroidales bacterium]